eukprot:UN08136
MAGERIQREFGGRDNFYYHRHVEEYVSRIAKSVNNDGTSPDLVLTGHSLGGAISKIVGSRLGLRTIAFNSPGLIYSHRDR